MWLFYMLVLIFFALEWPQIVANGICMRRVCIQNPLLIIKGGVIQLAKG